MLHHNSRGCRDFGTVAERKQGPNAVAPDAEMLGRIPGQGGQQVLTPYPEEQTRASSLASFGLPHNGENISTLPQNTQPYRPGEHNGE